MQSGCVPIIPQAGEERLLKIKSGWRKPAACAAMMLFPAVCRSLTPATAAEIESELRDRFLAAWYPMAIDSVCGGFISTFDANWKPVGPQHKEIVNQARHVWTASQAARFFPGDAGIYRSAAENGFDFLQSSLWDVSEGGFFQAVDRCGSPLPDGGGYGSEKRAYGNAFGIYACVAYFRLTGDSAAMDLAKKAFRWLDEKARDTRYGGYFQNLDRTGHPIPAGSMTARGFDGRTAGLKDQNSSIHLLEAFTALYSIWPDSVLGERVEEMALLIRDRMVDPKGFLRLFFYPDWTPVSYRDSIETVRTAHLYEDHVSFGHDMETAYLLIEADEALAGVLGTSYTLNIAKKMVDHSLKNGWDVKNGGFFERGTYFRNNDTLTVIDDSKSWWIQAEALHVLLMMAHRFPSETRYEETFIQQWSYMKTYLFDYNRGGWYEAGLDTRPLSVNAMKGHSWKAGYHETRAMLHCLELLNPDKWLLEM
jgi:mannobiose 2-epimerase